MENSEQFDFPGIKHAWLVPTVNLLAIAFSMTTIGMVILDSDNSRLTLCFVLTMVSIVAVNYIAHMIFIRSVLIDVNAIHFLRRTKISTWRFFSNLRPTAGSSFSAPKSIPINKLISAEGEKSSIWICYTDERGLQSEFHLLRANMEESKWTKLIARLKEISSL